MTDFSIREMPLENTLLMIRYFLTAELDYLNGLGVDPPKLPSESDWFALLEEDYGRPLEERHFYYLEWAVDGKPVGHSNINKIEYGTTASMHLHIWHAEHRQSGCATELLPLCIKKYFEVFDLQYLYCEPYEKNVSPNKALPKVGLHLQRTYETKPGWIALHQPANRWVIDRKTAFGS